MQKVANRAARNSRAHHISDGSAAIFVAGLSKRYDAAEAVRDISFAVGVGQIFGLLGPNGAGKTTTLECILGLRQPDGGSIQIAGYDLRTQAAQVKLMVGAQLQGATLQDKISPRQALDLFGSFYPRPYASEELLRRFDLQAKADAPFATLSGGQRQRLFLALALVNRPEVLVLDEPTAGLDPQARRELRSLIREMRAEGRTVLLTTHDVQEAAELCDRVAIMHHGRMVADAPPAELISRAAAPARLIVRTAPELPGAVMEALPEVTAATHSDRGWTLETRAPNRVLSELVRRIDEAGATLLAVDLRGPSLEDVFIELTGSPWSGDESREREA